MAVDAVDEIVDDLLELSFGNEAIDDAKIESAFGAHWLAGKNKFESDLGADQERQNGGCQWRKDSDADFGLRKARFRSGDHQIAEGRKLRAAADGRAVHDANDRLAELQHAGESGVERVEHLKNPLRGILADVDAA